MPNPTAPSKERAPRQDSRHTHADHVTGSHAERLVFYVVTAILLITLFAAVAYAYAA